MISQLEGVLIEKAPHQAVLDVQGVGYEIQIPLSTFVELPDVAGVGGASAAAEWGSSINPAAQAWNGEAGGSAQFALNPPVGFLQNG